MSSQVSAAPTTNHPQTSSKQTHQRNSSSRIERFLGIFGPKASGKTVYLTALYNLNIFSHEDESAFHLSVPDGHPTHSYLKRRWQQMAQQRQWIDATELRSPEEMLFHVTWQDPQGQTRDYRVVLPDACGELMDRAEEYSKTQRSNILQLQLKEDYFQQLKQSHGIALFIPGNLAAQSSEAAELKHAFDPLFDALKRERDQQGIKQPIAVIVTMWDLHSPYPQDRAQEEQKARDYIRSVLGHFVEDLEQLASKDFVKVFPISATGPLQPALPHSFAQTQHLPPPVQFRPYRIKAPVHWLLSAYEQLLLENSERAYEKAIQRPKLSQLTKLKTQINSSLQELAPSPQKERLEHISDQISDLVLALQKKSRRRKFFSTFVLLALLSSGVALWDKAFEKKAISIADQFLQDPKTTQMQRIETLKHLCLRRPLPTQSIFGCWQSITLKRTHVIQSGASAGWKELLPLPSEPSLSQLQARINELETFLQIYPNVPESTLARQQLAQAKGNFVQKRQAEQRLHWSRFLAQAQSAHTTVELEQATKTCHDQFLEKEEYIWMKLQISEACNRLRVKMRHQKEGTAVLSKLNEIKTKIAQDSQNTSLCIKETGDFLITYPRTQFSEEVKKIQDDCKKKEDEGHWNKQVALYKQENPTEYREIIKRAKEYLQNPQYKIYTQEARSLIQKTEIEWDRSQYQQIQKNWQNNHSKLDAATIDRIHTKCEEYIANAPTKQMKAAVENWLRWHKKLRSGIQFNLVIERIHIGTEWYSRLHWPDVVVFVKVGTQEKKSEEFGDLKVETEYSSNEDNHLVRGKLLPQTLGPFTWRYGSDDITVRMLNTEITQAYEKSQTANKEKYNISFLRGQVAVQYGFYIHARIEPVSFEDRTPNSAIFPDYND